MNRYAYDLHMHTCLSPCGDNEMTPPNIANMAYVKGLDIIAITDHNSAKNAAAVIAAARALPLTVIPGIEVTTAEEIHMVCLFPDAESAEKAGDEIYNLLPPVKNKTEYFGHQLIVNEYENVLGEVDFLLPNAADISYDKLPEFVARFGGVCFPAHIDRQTTSVLSVFGILPDFPTFPVLEVHRPELFFSDPSNEHYRCDYKILTNSDAHQLVDISERQRFIELEEPSFAALKASLFK